MPVSFFNSNKIETKSCVLDCPDKDNFDRGLDLKLSQCFGDCSSNEEISEADILTAIQFDAKGEYLATGDKAGRVVIFKENSPVKSKVSSTGKIKRVSDFRFYTEFQSHFSEFDYLKSLEIEEKINKIKWIDQNGPNKFVLTTNDKTIKLWRIKEAKNREIHSYGGIKEGVNNKYISLPKTSLQKDLSIHSNQKRAFANGHAYHINSIDTNSKNEVFISSDDLRINLWSMEVERAAYTVTDIKPNNMESLSEVITCCNFSPFHCSTFMHSTSRGKIYVSDLRQNSNCNTSKKVLGSCEGSKNLFGEIVASISDIKQTNCGRHVVSRDFMSVKVWDVRSELQPMKTIDIHHKLQPMLKEMYENDSIFDKFECALNGANDVVATGSYNKLSTIDINDQSKHYSIPIVKDLFKRRKSKFRSMGEENYSSTNGPSFSPTSQNFLGKVEEAIPYEKKILNMSWHPRQDVIAVAGQSKLYLYTAQNSSTI